MSAPNTGRQSPEPEHQTHDQSGSMTSKANEQGGAPSKTQNAQQNSDDTKDGLPSNPEHVLAEHAESTTSKK
ncbi:hypothetical protein BCR34DRAFT_529929 [Clohesyomyces aquaticus]|uniref:Uncharacterized protein n=1 Tax=Clohesyomyces aquaticus TaxID=1231657 RepID=A0A1Y2A5L7_9PLEO|nr:hypothetical protein BCR34DRAFT_529929 [Clohesyomyces aquaticus]